MSRVHEGAPLTPPLVFAQPSRSSTVVATGAAVFAAAAAAAALVISVARPTAPEPVIVEKPTPSATPVVVTGEMQIEKLGHLVLDVAPGDATVEIDGQPIAGPSPFVATNLPAGKHELKVNRDGYQPWIKVIDVPAAELQLPITLMMARPGMAASVKQGEMAPQPGDPVPASSGTDPLDPKAKYTKATVGAGLDKDIVRRVVRAHIDEVRHCYNLGLVKNENLAGRVAVQFTISFSGGVESAKAVESTLPDQEVTDCIVNAVKRWKFPKPDGGGSVAVTYPFMLEPG
ncbi:MAG TPA: TonB family protein [Nannocystaceae bacterium]|nr:TonB family protein [Nannocystaceae bacterium]